MESIANGSAQNILVQLRQSTSGEHEAVESVVPLLKADLTISEYVEYLQRLLPWYRRMEAEVLAVEGLPDVVPDLTERWKTDLIVDDLRTLGKAPSATPVLSIENSRKVRNIPQALGCLYVLEGSTLGGQILVRTLHEKFGYQISGATRFLNSYGDAVGDRWKRFGQVLMKELVSAEQQKEAISTAKATFVSFREWMTNLNTERKLAVE